MVVVSLCYTSIRAGVVVAVTFHEVDSPPDAKAGTESHYESLKNTNCGIEKSHEITSENTKTALSGGFVIDGAYVIRFVSLVCFGSELRR